MFAIRHDVKFSKEAKSSKYWNDLLHLLGLVLMQDGIASPKRVKAFVDGAIELRTIIRPKDFIDRVNLALWLEKNERALRLTAEKIDDNYLHNLLKNIAPSGFKLDILTVLVQITIADGTYGSREQDLTKKIILLWDLPEKAYVDIKYVCSDIMA